MKLQTSQNISIAHFVPTTKKTSPCRQLHGHTLKVQVSITGDIQSDGMILDFRDIKSIIKEYDHKTLISTYDVLEPASNGDCRFMFEENDHQISMQNIMIVEGTAPTCELLAKNIQSKLQKLAPQNEVTVRIYESENSYIET